MKNTIIKAIAIVLLFNSILFSACNKSISNADITTDEQIKKVASNYNFTVGDLLPNTYGVSTIMELNMALQDYKNYKESQHVQPLIEGNKKNSELRGVDIKREISKIETLSKFLHTEKIKVRNSSLDDNPDIGAIGYKYSKTYYLKGSGTTPNYYVRIDYNTDGYGHFSGDPLFTSGIYGTSLASYSQIGFNFYTTYSGTIVFEITGINKVNISIKGFTLSDGTVTTFTGYINLLQPNFSSGTSLDFGQFTGGAIWWTLTAPTKAQK